MRPLAVVLLLIGTARADLAPPNTCVAPGDPAQYNTVKIVGKDGAQVRSSSIFTSDENNVIGRLAPGTRVLAAGPLHHAEGSAGIGWAVLLTDGGRSCRGYVSDSVVADPPRAACYTPGAPQPRLPKLVAGETTGSFKESWVTVDDTSCPSALTHFLSVGGVCPAENHDLPPGPYGTFVHHLPVDGDVVRVTYGTHPVCNVVD